MLSLQACTLLCIQGYTCKVTSNGPICVPDRRGLAAKTCAGKSCALYTPGPGQGCCPGFVCSAGGPILQGQTTGNCYNSSEPLPLGRK